MFGIHATGNGLVDIVLFLFCALAASLNFRPSEFWRWVFFALFMLVAVLLFIAWLGDLGAHL